MHIIYCILILNIFNVVDVDMLCHILSEFKQILQSPQTNMENVHFICDILQNIWCTINLENKVSVYSKNKTKIFILINYRKYFMHSLIAA